MDRKSWVLLAIAHPTPSGSPPRGLDQVRLIKTLFLVQQHCRNTDGLDFEFEPYLYGPFTSAIYWQTEDLAREGMINIIPDYGRRRMYSPTPGGVKRAEELAGEVDPTAVRCLLETRDWAMRSSFQEIVRRIYDEFPVYKENSVFQE